MKKPMRLLALLSLGVLCALLLVQIATAMSSPNYRLEWYTPLSGGGAPAVSTNYAVNLTVGQSASGKSTAARGNACVGYWCSWAGVQLNLPLIRR